MKAALLLSLSIGCVSTGSVVCDDGVVCPNGTVCVTDPASGQACAVQDQLDACTGLFDGDPCTFATMMGACHGGLCSAVGCGNHVRELGEVCDDGNAISGDGCRSDCQKIEACNDGILDEGESCDDENDNPADGCDRCVVTSWVATPLIGTDTTFDIALKHPRSIAVDVLGNIFIADTEHDVVRKIDPSNVITTIAGIGTRGFGGDNGPARAAELNAPSGLAVDGLGNLFIADTGNRVVRRVDRSGVITTIAGVPEASGNDGDGAAAVSGHLAGPYGLAIDGLGDLFIADTGNDNVRRIDAGTGIITTIAGSGGAGFGGDGGPATAAKLADPRGLAVDPAGAIFIADTTNHRIRRIDPTTHVITTVAGTGVPGFSGDAGPATNAQLQEPYRVALDRSGGIAIVDTANSRIRRVDAAGMIATIAGSGPGAGGDGLPATLAKLLDPSDVVFDSPATLYIADATNNRIRRVDVMGIMSTFAGTGSSGDGDDGTALSTPIVDCAGVALDSTGVLYVSDSGNHRIRTIDAAGGIATIAGDGTLGSAVQLPQGLAFVGGALYVSDMGHGRIGRVEANGTLTTIAVPLSVPRGFAVDASGNIFVAESFGHRIRRIDATTHAITTVAGTGTAGFSGDGTAATGAKFSSPVGVAVDGANDLFIADQGNDRIRRIDGITGIITTFAGGGATLGDDGPATAALINGPAAVAFDATGNLVIGEEGNHRIRRVDTNGIITTIAGIGIAGAEGDAAPAKLAHVTSPRAIAFDQIGNLYYAEFSSDRIRRIDPTGVITTVAGAVDPAGVGLPAHARLADPRALVATPTFTLFAGGTSGTVESWVRDGSLDVVAGRYPHEIATGALARYRDENFGPVEGVAYDEASKRIFLTAGNQILVVTATDPDRSTWTIAALDASPDPGFADGPIATAKFRGPTGLFFDAAAHALYVADTGNHVVRVIDLVASTVRTIAGMPGTRGVFGDRGLATAAYLDAPQAVTVCKGDVFIADTENHRVRRVDATRTITTVLGVGTGASAGDGAPASSFPVDTPLGVACDDLGNLYVTSSSTVRLVEADVITGIVDGTRGVHTIYGDRRDAFPASASSCLTGILVVDGSTVQVTDACAGLLVELKRVRPEAP